MVERLERFVEGLETVVRVFRLRKKPMNLCVSDDEYNEEREHDVGGGVNVTMLSETL